MPPGCRFQPRCTYAAAACEARQPMLDLAPAHLARCCRAQALSLPGAVN
jgi:ABC-type dipeptide/oligopeptide/nickel transport system ATPase component